MRQKGDAFKYGLLISIQLKDDWLFLVLRSMPEDKTPYLLISVLA